jgi:hypothetical protein
MDSSAITNRAYVAFALGLVVGVAAALLLLPYSVPVAVLVLIAAGIVAYRSGKTDLVRQLGLVSVSTGVLTILLAVIFLLAHGPGRIETSSEYRTWEGPDIITE